MLFQAEAKCDTPEGSVRAEDPLGKVIFFTKLAEAAPLGKEVFFPSAAFILINILSLRSLLKVVTSSQFVSTL